MSRSLKFAKDVATEPTSVNLVLTLLTYTASNRPDAETLEGRSWSHGPHFERNVKQFQKGQELSPGHRIKSCGCQGSTSGLYSWWPAQQAAERR